MSHSRMSTKAADTPEANWAVKPAINQNSLGPERMLWPFFSPARINFLFPTCSPVGRLQAALTDRELPHHWQYPART